MNPQHTYSATIRWTGNTGSGTETYKGYDRSFTATIAGKPDLEGSSDPAFRGNPHKYNPEELLLLSIASCHMLWFLHLCSEAGVIVTQYVDQASGTMEESGKGGGRFTEVVLHPMVTVRDTGMIAAVSDLHQQANKLCFIANSVNFPVRHEGSVHSGHSIE